MQQDITAILRVDLSARGLCKYLLKNLKNEQQLSIDRDTSGRIKTFL